MHKNANTDILKQLIILLSFLELKVKIPVTVALILSAITSR